MAHQWGTPGLIGTTLRCLGELQDESPGGDGRPALRAAVEALAASPRRLEEARARASLGRALLRSDRSPEAAREESRNEAQAHLHRALDLADQCAARGLREEVAALLQ